MNIIYFVLLLFKYYDGCLYSIFHYYDNNYDNYYHNYYDNNLSMVKV